MKIFHREQGAIDILLTALIIVALGAVAAGLYFRAKNSGPVTSPAKPASHSKYAYLVIKEWGVKVPQMPTGNVLSYQTSANDKSRADFVSSEQKALGGSCGQFSFARYHVYQSETGKSNDEFLQSRFNDAAQNNLAVKVNDKTYYIISDMSGGVCVGNPGAGQSMSQQEATANQHILDSLKGIAAN